MTADTPWDLLARLLHPDATTPTAADERWDAGTGVGFGRGPLPTGRPGGDLARFAWSRERSLWRHRRGSDGLVVRLPPPGQRPHLIREKLMRWLRSGAVLGSGRDVLDAVAGTAGVRPTGPWIPGSGGSLLCRGRMDDRGDVMLRVGLAETAADPRVQAPALEAVAGHPLAPRLLATGTHGSAAWLVESALAGARPRSLTQAQRHTLARLLADLPRSPSVPTAHRDDLVVISERLPRYAESLSDICMRMDQTLVAVPAMARHGDLWLGNLLVRQGQVTGLIDWDAWHPAAPPGVDLLQLVATTWRHRRRGRTLGDAWHARLHETAAFVELAARVWSTVDLTVDEHLQETYRLAWWAGEVAGTLRRLPLRAHDAAWVDANVAAVIAD